MALTLEMSFGKSIPALFSAAKAMQVDVLKSIRDELDRSVPLSNSNKT
ncbi:hypothetical protein KOI40_00545 [Aestuariicella sp. G3-2]|nr:hypothetical protein [Aestuariicella albida]MBU3068281.1 hypothetical protein [Aestuariicella albida]